MDFNSISLVPRVISKIESRNDIKIKINIFNHNYEASFTAPIIASPMKDVCDSKVARIMAKNGGLGVLHRFNTIEDQVEEFRKSDLVTACAIGVEGDSFDRYQALKEAGCTLFVIDTANGANIKVERMAKKMNANIIVGNVASKECFEWLQDIDNVVGIRVGIAGGSACLTRNATGIYHGMASCIAECASVKNEKVLLIADGGIKEPGDFCKAIALGADMVILGSEIAATKDSPAEILIKDSKSYKIMHGSASHEIQKNYRETPRYIEGRTRLLESNDEHLSDLITRYCDGLRSSMSYFNSLNLEEYREKISFEKN